MAKVLNHSVSSSRLENESTVQFESSPPKKFVGRTAELDNVYADITAVTEDGTPNRQIHIFSGPTGIGKTALALQVEQRCRQNNIP